MNFAIISPTRVEVDGADAGLLYDFIIAHPELKTEIKAGLVAWHASHVIADQGREAARAAAVKAAADSIAAKEAEHAEAVAELTAQVESLGGTELAEQKAKASAVEAARSALAQAAATYAGLTGEPLPSDVTSTSESGKP